MISHPEDISRWHEKHCVCFGSFCVLEFVSYKPFCVGEGRLFSWAHSHHSTNRNCAAGSLSCSCFSSLHACPFLGAVYFEFYTDACAAVDTDTEVKCRYYTMYCSCSSTSAGILLHRHQCFLCNNAAALLLRTNAAASLNHVSYTSPHPSIPSSPGKSKALAPPSGATTRGADVR